MQRSVAILLSTIVVVAMMVATWRYLGVRGPTGQLLLTRVSGEVQLLGVGRNGVAKAGTTLHSSDRIQTIEGRAVMELDGGSRVRIGPSSSVVVQSVDENGVALELQGGALQAVVRPDSGTVAVTGGEITAQATDAEFSASVNDAGDLVVVESTAGDVVLMGTDKTRVRAGTRAVIHERSAKIGPIPTELLLSVAWPQAQRTRRKTTTITGTTAPGARVRLTGPFGIRSVTASETGAFVATVPLVEGANRLEVTALDLSGRERDVTGILQTRDTKGPTFRGGVEYGN